jgi:hypothetical protein
MRIKNMNVGYSLNKMSCWLRNYLKKQDIIPVPKKILPIKILCNALESEPYAKDIEQVIEDWKSVLGI